MNLTHWFPPSIKPVHIGYYETSYPLERNITLDYWDGQCWLCSKSGIIYMPTVQSLLYWRGVLQ